MNLQSIPTIGVLGGGQLGTMLAQAASNYSIPLAFLDPNIHAPCKHIAKTLVQGNLMDFDTVYTFGQQYDVLTIEIEHVNTDALIQLEKEGKLVYPQPTILQLIQDKRRQKQFYKNYNIPTADFRLVTSQNTIQQQKTFFPAVYKQATAGYDGKGVYTLRTQEDINQPMQFPGLLEQYIAIQKELSIIIARDIHGNIQYFPITELTYHPLHHLVSYLVAPADISQAIEQAVIQWATTIIQKLSMVGVLAVEFFLTQTGQLLVNEIAPRPHNSGHHTIEANTVSQFDQHLRAILHWPLATTRSLSLAAMVNLVGAINHHGPTVYQGIEKILALEGASIHLYGKHTTKPMRKMGHVTIVDNDQRSLIKKIKFVQKNLTIIT